MKKVVFFTDLAKLHEALGNFDIQSFKDKRVPVKLHMGEPKNKYFPKPDFVKHVIDELKKIKAKPFLFDTTVAYPGLRGRKSGYEKVAKLHGFTLDNVGCNVVIGNKGIPTKIEKREYQVAKQLAESTHIFAISHVKGHIAAGMGGAIKNFGMGGVTKKTKSMMHKGSRSIHKKELCTYCGVCSEVCPFDAITVSKNKWKQNIRACFGCGVCVDACEQKALWYKDADLQFVLACSAKACVKDKNVIYVNELKRIADSCDCDPSAASIICPDIGYLISDDPVAIDKASLDLINDVKKDIFIKTTTVNPMKQIKYGEEIGLGSTSYKLIKL